MRTLLRNAGRKQTDLAATRAVLRSQVEKYSSLLDELKAAQRRKLQQISAAKKAAIAAPPPTTMKRKVAAAPPTTSTTTTTKQKVVIGPPTTKTKRKVVVGPPTTKKKRKIVVGPARTTKKHKVPIKPISPARAPSSRAAIAVKFALAQLGKAYVFAASGPRAFDCSGLTMAAWAAAGVSLPHFAAWQYNAGHHVSRSQLQPGDLVFFYSPISHDGMYIGHGLIVHAPHTGDVVRIAPLSNWSGSDYVGATRPS